ncbi:carboxypeptidase regulatory-like domain-containing protein [candidate division WOR-3 bacterium]|nr:carboxypeptidase regulatory-like domain-containing protein [candidate division WOR-3 bacterium]
MSENGIGRNLTQFERNKYFYGKLMTVRDFETEQNFFNEKRHLLNWLIHGIGIVCGLEVREPEIDNRKLKIKLSPGVAIDCRGREIVVGKEFAGKELEVKEKEHFHVGSNYIYLKYKECEKETVSVLANVSTCEEVCRDNRVEEVFELELDVAPVNVTGNVTESDETHIEGALVEALQNGIVKGITITDNNGDYTLMLSSGTYVIRASASGYESEVRSNIDAPKSDVDFVLDKETAPKDSKELWEDIPQEYYKEHLKFCPECDDAKVLLAVIDYNAETKILKINPETYKYRAIVYNNPMLYELISSHLVDFNNPHRTTAEQVGALVSVDGVKNPGGDVDLESKSGSAITITPDDDANTITIGENHSGKKDNPHKVTAAQIDIQDNLVNQIVNQINAGTGTIDEERIDPEITRDSELKAHINDEDNPHEVSAEQVRALKSVNKVGNVNKKYVENINLESEDDTIGITPKVSEDKIDLKLNDIAEEKIMFDTENGHNHDGINSRLIECYESNLAHVESINWKHNGDTPINEIGSNEANFIRLEVTFDKDMLSETINEHTFLVMVRIDVETHNDNLRGDFYYDYLRADVIDVGEGETKKAKFTIYGAERFIDREFKVVLKSDFIQDKDEKALDGNFIGGEPPSGNGFQGGDFESWFKLTPAAGDTACIRGKIVRTYPFTGEEPLPGASVTVTRSGTKEVIAKGSTDASGVYCIDNIPLEIQVDIFVERGEHLYYKAEMKGIDTGTTPGNCIAGNCVEIVKLIAT